MCQSGKRYMRLKSSSLLISNYLRLHYNYI